MSSRSTSTDRTVIDPLFVIPEGAEDEFVYSQEGPEIDDGESDDNIMVSDDFDLVEIEDTSYDDIVDDGYDDEDQVILDTPVSFSVIAQTLRRAPGGQMVVDIVVQTEDIDGAENYEIQVVKL